MFSSNQHFRFVKLLSKAQSAGKPYCIQHISSLKLAYTKHHPENVPSESSQSTPLVILHGLFASKNSWQSLSKRFANELGTQVIAVDARNHGESPHKDHMDYVLMADDISQLFSDLQIKQAHLLGHSMGGKTAMKFALRHPDLLKSLIIEDVTPTISPNSTDIRNIIHAAKSINLKLDGQKITQLRRKASMDLEKGIPNAGVRTLMLQNLIPDTDQTDRVRWRDNFDSIVSNLDALLGWDEDAVIGERYNGPSCFIGGANSTYMPGGIVEGEARKMLLDYFPRLKFNVVQDAGHWVHSEQPVKFTEIFCDFIISVEEGKS